MNTPQPQLHMDIPYSCTFSCTCLYSLLGCDYDCGHGNVSALYPCSACLCCPSTSHLGPSPHAAPSCVTGSDDANAHHCCFCCVRSRQRAIYVMGWPANTLMFPINALQRFLKTNRLLRDFSTGVFSTGIATGVFSAGKSEYIVFGPRRLLYS